MSLWDRVKKVLGVPGTVAGEVPAAPTVPTTSPVGTITPTTPAVPAVHLSPPAPVLASAFLPIGRDELLSRAEEVRRGTGWMFFGRRDIIPPTSDPRTLLIDRGMVTQGFLTPQRLAEMHTVGDQWSQHADRVRHISVKAGETADAAVEADRAARTEVKLRKKAEAAAKRKTWIEAVAERKAGNIIFVGRGVSGRMNHVESDVAKLSAAGLPVIHTPANLANALGLTIPKLRWLAFHTETATRIHYVQFDVPKKSWGTRTLSAPHTSLALVQNWILLNILAKLPTEPPAHGFVPGRSTVTNAAQHCNRDVVLNVDLEAFFPSIRFARVRHLFQFLGYSGCVATLLALLCTECPRQKVTYAGTLYYVATGPRRLPQGACTSPAISNQIARRLDRRLAGFARKMDLNYTRYADDLTFSATASVNDKLGYLLARIRHIADEEGFALNAKKTRVRRRNAQQTVTGLVVNATPAVPRKTVRRVRAILHRAGTEGLAAQNRGQHPNFKAWLDGMIAYISMVKPDLGSRLRTEFESLNSVDL
ncbi:retron St85 family RNA-directed DNA polymerase [soil metagenome]